MYFHLIGKDYKNDNDDDGYDRKDVDLHLSFPSDAQQTQSVTAG